MGRTKNNSESDFDSKAKPVLEALQLLAKDFASQKDGRKKLQEATGLSRGGLDGLLYSGKGSPSTWINVFLCIFELQPKDAIEALRNLEVFLKEKTKLDPLDVQWFSISRNCSSEKKKYWLSIIEFAIKLEGKK